MTARLRWSRRYRWQVIYRDQRGVASAVAGHRTPWGALLDGWRTEHRRRKTRP